MTVADVFVEELQSRGVQFIATLNGHGLDPLYLACRRAGMRMIDVRNEQAAAYMAEVAGRLSRSVAVVADDQRWGISASGHTKNYGQPLYSTLGPTRLDQVAEGFGCRGVRVEKKEELVPALQAALSGDRPTVIHVPIVPGGPDD